MNFSLTHLFARLRAAERIRLPIVADSQLRVFQTLSLLRSQGGRWRSLPSHLRSRLAGRGLLSTILTVGGVTLLVKFAMAGKEVFVARQLGVGDALDAFLVAFSLPGIAINIISGSFNVALIPTYIQVRERSGDEQARHLLSGVMFWNCGFLLAASLLLAAAFPVLLPYLAHGGFSPSKLDLTRLLFGLLLPVVAATGLQTTWIAILNAHGEFAAPAAVPLITSVVIVAGLLSPLHVSTIFGLALWTLTGSCLEMAVLYYCLWRKGISVMPRRRGMAGDMRQVIRQYVPLAAASLVFSGTTLADQTIAARLGSGSVSALSYGGKITAMIMVVAATAVSTSVLPHFSRLVAVGDWAKLRGDLRAYSVLILGALIPVAALLSFFSIPLVRLVFERGAFTASSTHLVAQVQACLSLQLPFYTLGLMYLRLTSALKNNQRILQVATASVILNFVLDVVFAKHLGVPGIALSTSCVSVIYCVILYIFLHRALPKPPPPPAAPGTALQP